MKKNFLIIAMLIIINMLTISTISVSAEQEGIYTYDVSYGEATIIECDRSASGDIIIPNTLGGYPVTSIYDWAFSDCSNLRNITIPNGVNYIGDYAFYCCSSLKNIAIPNSVNYIGDEAFYGCSSLRNITIPNGVTYIGDEAFSACLSLSSIDVNIGNTNYCSLDGVLFNKNKTRLLAYPINKTNIEYIIPNSVTSVGVSAFCHCYLPSITIPDSVTSIGDFAFSHCYYLSSITIPNGVTSIGKMAFSACSSLSSITIPDSVTSIGDFAFSDCYGLSRITIPDSITHIANGAFSGCDSLSSITIPDSVTSIGDWAFSDCSSLTDVYYSGSEDKWNKISIIFGNEELTNATIHYNQKNSDVYVPEKNNQYSTENRFGKGISFKVSGVRGAISNAAVQIGEYQVLTNDEGIAEFPEVLLRKKYLVKVSADGYFEETFVRMFFEKTGTITLLNESDNIRISSVFYGKDSNIYGDLIDYNPVIIQKTDIDKYFITANIDWGKNPAGEIYLKGKNSKKEIKFVGNTLNVAIGKEFDSNEKFQLIIKTNGKTYIKDLKLQTNILSEVSNIKFPYINSETISDKFPFLGGNKFNIGLDLLDIINTDGEVEIEDGKYVIKVDYSNDKIKKKYAKIWGDKTVEGTVGIKIEIPIEEAENGNWSGYITFKSGNKYESEGVCDYLEFASLKNNYVITTPIGPVPVYMELKLSSMVDIEVGIEHNNKNYKLNGKIKPGIKGHISGGPGIGYDSAEIKFGPYGNAQFSATANLNPPSLKPNIELDFGVQLAAKVWFIDARAEFGLGHFQWPDENAEPMLFSIESDEMKLFERKYDLNPNEFVANNNISLFGVENSSNKDTLLYSNVFPTIQGKFLKINNDEILLFTNDNEKRETQNGLTLMFSKKINNEWSKPIAVYDDFTLDSSISADGEFVVWENTKHELDADVDWKSAMSQSEIVVSQYNGIGYNTPITLTNNNIADFAPVIKAFENKAIVAWISNTESDIFSQNGKTSVNYALFNGSEWSQIYSIENVGAVTRIELQYKNGIAKIIYKNESGINIFDIETKYNTLLKTGDITFYTSSSEAVYVFEQNGAVKCVDFFGNEKIIYDKNECNSIPQFVENNNIKYLLWCENGDEGNKLCGLKFEDGKWSKKIDFINGDFEIHSPSISLYDDNLYVTHLRKESNTEQEYYSLHLTEILPNYNLHINNVFYENNRLIYSVINKGNLPVNGYKICITQNDNTILEKTINANLASGEQMEEEILLEGLQPEYSAKIDILAMNSESDIIDDFVVFNKPSPDLTVLYSKLVQENNLYYIDSEIANDGFLTANSVKVELRKSGYDGEIVYSETFKNILPNESICLRYNVKNIGEKYYLCLICEDDTKTWNNFSHTKIFNKDDLLNICNFPVNQSGNIITKENISSTSCVRLDIEKLSLENQDSVIIVAFYDSDGKLVSLNKKDATITEKIEIVGVPVSGEISHASKLKVFMWNSLSSLKPLSKIGEFDFDMISTYDVNRDGKIDEIDSQCIIDVYYNGAEKDATFLYDVNNDGNIDHLDLKKVISMYDTIHDATGDVNNDSIVNESDIECIKEYILQKTPMTLILFLEGDMNGDGRVNSTDILFIKKNIR